MSLAGRIAHQLGVYGLHLAVARHRVALPHGHGVLGDADDLTRSVVVQHLACAIDSGLSDQAVGCVVRELVGLTVFVDQGRQAPCCVVARLDAHNNWSVVLLQSATSLLSAIA